MMPLFIVPHFSPSLPPLCFASSVPLSHQGREALATSYAPYRLYNIGNNEPMQLMQYIRAIEPALGMQAKMNMLPMQAGDVRATAADVSRLIADTGSTPDTKIGDGVARFVVWYREYYNV